MGKLFTSLLFCVSILIAACAAYFSVRGIGLLFAGSFTAVVIMASSLEIGKLFAVSLLYRQWHVMRFLYKIYLTLSCGLLIFITSLGIFGFLSDAYQDTKTKVEFYGEKIVSLKGQTAGLRERITQLNSNTKSTKVSSSDSVDKYKKIYDDYVTQSNTRIEQLNEQLSVLDGEVAGLESQPGGLFSSKKKKLTLLKTEQEGARQSIATSMKGINDKIGIEYSNFMSKVDMLSDNKDADIEAGVELDTIYNQIRENDDTIIQHQSSIAQTDIGSFKFISKSFDVPVDQAVKWFILVIVIVFDPLAICLIIGYNMVVMGPRKIVKPKVIVEPPVVKPKTKIVPVRNREPVVPPDESSRQEVVNSEGKRVILFGKGK